jgi:hypothetical protein
MTKTSRHRRKPVTTEPSVFDLARDEMFQHIIQCGVIGADPEHQAEWFTDTMTHMAQRWHELSPKEMTDLRTLGERFARPARGSAAAPVVVAAPQPEADDESTADVDAAVEELNTVSA